MNDTGTIKVKSTKKVSNSETSKINNNQVKQKVQRNKKEMPETSKINNKQVKPYCDISCNDFSIFFDSIKEKSIDLILTDPPYAISRKTGFQNKTKKGIKRFAVSMDFGEWDHSEVDLSSLAKKAYLSLRDGGTIIVWYDIWKISHLAEALQDAGFVMLRMIIWNKTNPVPLNSRRTYLSNSREIAVVGVKKGSPTFNSKYDNGIYMCDENQSIIYNEPIPRHNGKRIHPTQKPITIFEDLVKKHSNEGDLVCDPFLGSGTTAIAAVKNMRNFIGCDIQKKYARAASERVNNEK